ncbi:MAG: NfeD family protein [Clostridia bacterium]|nr:NfeD family protein [Clostridia bacterium]
MTGAAIVWFIAAVIFGLIEGLTVSLVSIWMAVASVCAAIAAALGGNILVQVLVFLLVSIILLIATVPLSKRFHEKKLVKTNADRLIGVEAVVVERVDPIDNKGKIKVMGQIWSATDANYGTLEIGEKVVVQSIEGVHAIVEKLSLS